MPLFPTSDYAFTSVVPMCERQQLSSALIQIIDKKKTNEEIFRRLFTTFYDRLYGFALSRVLSRDAAADITNEVF